MQSHIRVGVIGAGVSATTFHAPFIKTNPAFQLVKFHRSSQKPVLGYEALPVVTDLSSFLTSQPEIDLVVITTPTNTHYELARACLDSGKHVILEKPMTAAYQEAKQLCDVARAKNKLLAVYQNRRWDGDFQTVEKLVACGALGRVVEYESHFDRFRNTVKPGWKEEDLPGSGILYDLGSHLIDQAICLFGPPTAITANVLNQRQLPASKVPDAFTVTLHYKTPTSAPTSHLELPQVRSENLGAPGGSFTGPSVSMLNAIENLAGSITTPMSHRPLTVILRASMLTKIPGPRFVIHGTQGSYIKQGMDVQEGQLRSGMLVTDPGFGVEEPEGFGTLDSLALDPPGSAAAAAAPATGAAIHSSSGVPTVDAAAVAAGVLAKVDSGGVAAAAAGAAANSGAVLKVITERGRWKDFYNNVAEVLLAKKGLDASEGPGGALGSIAEAPASAAPPAAAAAQSGSSSSTGGNEVHLNSMLAVKPEEAVEVIRLIEAAMQSSQEGRTVYLN
jgi:scyllo-inositol 2-dehydrogenase (NADP+)